MDEDSSMQTAEQQALSEEQASALRRLGFPHTPEIVEALLTAVRRGHHVAAIAAEGSGKETLYGIAIGERCDPAIDAVQALVLAPTRETACRAAVAARELGLPRDLRALAQSEGAERSVETAAGGKPPHCIAGRPVVILSEVRAGRLGLASLRLLIVDGVADIAALEQWASVEALLDTLPADAQKIVVSDRVDERLEELLVRRLHRARRWPTELFKHDREDEGGSGAGSTRTEPPTVLYGSAVSEAGRLDLLDGMVHEMAPGDADAVLVHCMDGKTARRVAVALETRGSSASLTGERTVTAGVGDRAEATILYGLPLSLEEVRRAWEGAKRLCVILPSLHVRQLELMARRAGWTLQPCSGFAPDDAFEAILHFRRRVRGQIERESASAELLVLEPLLSEFGSDRVAAALSALLRRREEAASPVRPWADVEAASGLGVAPSPARRPERGVRPAWTRIHIASGKRDSVRPADLVGAITGEAGLVGAQIGKIEIRGSFSLVDIDSQVVDEVIRKLNGAMIRGREVAVRLERGA
ncbi:MAG: DbpA RNA binding domain-containing protein [Gemmatimonadota bacterium]